MHLCAMAIISFEYHRQYRVMKVNNKSAIGAVGELLVLYQVPLEKNAESK